MGEKYNIHVIHQAAGRVLRRDIFDNIIKFAKEFEEVEAELFSTEAEAIANKLEEKFIYNNQHLPVFDYDIN